MAMDPLVTKDVEREQESFFRRWLPLLSVVTIYLILATYRLGYKSLWIDEAFSIRDAHDIAIFNWIRPMYFLILRVWIHFGEGEVYLTIPSVIFGVLTVITLYFFSKSLFDKEVAFWSTFILSLSSTYIRFSQQIRFYTLITLASVIGMFFFIYLCRSYNTKKLIGFWITTVLCLLVSPTLIFMVLTQVVYLFVFYRDDKKLITMYFAGGISFAVLLSPYVVFVYRYIKKWEETTWIKNLQLSDLSGVIRQIGSVMLGGKIFEQIMGFTILGICALLIYYFFREREKYVFLILMWFILPLLIILAASLLELNFFHRRTIYFTMPALCMLFGFAIARINLVVKIAVTTIVVFTSIFSLYKFYPARSYYGEDWRSAAKFINKKINRDKTVILLNPHYADRVFNYYFGTDHKLIPIYGYYTDEVINKKLHPYFYDGYDNIVYVVRKGRENNLSIEEAAHENHRFDNIIVLFIDGITWWENFQELNNASFETGPRIPASWKGSGSLTRKNKRVKNKANNGLCSFKINGNGDKKYIKQVIETGGMAGDTFTLGGWSKAKRVPKSGGSYRMEVKVSKNGSKVARFKKGFTKGTHPWEYKEKRYTIADSYDKVIVFLRYGRGTGKVWFDGIRLIVE